MVQKEDNIILSKKEKIENLNEKNMLESIINDFDIKFKNEIMLKYKINNWNGSNRLLTILSYNKIKYFQEKFDIFKYLKNLDYTNFSYLENIFGFLLSL